MERRSPRPLMGILPLICAFALPLAAQDIQAGDNPLSGCFRVGVGVSVPAANRALEDAEVVQFVFEPSHAWANGYERTWRLSESTSAETVAFWWLEGDELVAIWPDADRILTLRLVHNGRDLTGTAVPTLQPNAARARVVAQPVRCAAATSD